MIDRIYETPCGTISYWISDNAHRNDVTLVFLPGLTADHRLFDKQIAYFEKQYLVFVWDAPGHAASYPFEMTLSLMDKARWLNEILEKEGMTNPVIVGQSMEADLPYEIKCPALVICGKKDHAGSCVRYNKAWHQQTGIPIEWIKNAGHNSNTDAPEIVNGLIERVIREILNL